MTTRATPRSGTLAAPAAPPRPVSPLGGAIEDAQATTLSWLSVDGATGYVAEVARDRLFQRIVVTVPTGAANQVTLNDMLSAGTTLYWRVRAQTRNGETRWSPYGRFVAGSDSQYAAYRRQEEGRKQAKKRDQESAREKRTGEDSILPFYQRPDRVPSDSDVKLAIALFVIPIVFIVIAYVIGRIAIA